MEQLDMAAASTIASANAMWASLSALAVTYAFSLLGAIVLLVVGFIIAGQLERAAYAGLGRFKAFDETLRRFFSKLLRYLILILVGVTVLGQFGVQTASIIAALGAVGLAIGLALQGTLQNIAAGIMLLVLRPFRAGEFINAGSVSGIVQEVGLFATELKTFDGIYVLAPNSQLWNSPVTNFSRNTTRRGDIEIGIGYGDDIGKASSVLMDLVTGDPRVLDDPAPMVYVTALGDSAINVKIHYWTTTGDFFVTKNELTKAAKEAFDANGISIPFPQREVTYREVKAAPDGAPA